MGEGEAVRHVEQLGIFFSHDSKARRFCQSNARRRIGSSRHCHHCGCLTALLRLGLAHRTLCHHGQWRDLDATSKQIRKYLSSPWGRRTRVARSPGKRPSKPSPSRRRARFIQSMSRAWRLRHPDRKRPVCDRPAVNSGPIADSMPTRRPRPAA
jgi:hypothetical protein